MACLRRFELTPFALILIVAHQRTAAEAYCTGYLIPPTAPVYKAPSASPKSVDSATRDRWTIAIPHPGTANYALNKVKLDSLERLNRAGGCGGRDIHEERALVRVWFQPLLLEDKERWVRKDDLVRFEYAYPGHWDSQSLGENLTIIRDAAAPMIERLSARQAATSPPATSSFEIHAPFASSWGALARALESRGLAIQEQDRAAGVMTTRRTADFPQTYVTCPGTVAGRPELVVVTIVKRVEDESLLKVIPVFSAGEGAECHSTGRLEGEIGAGVGMAAREAP